MTYRIERSTNARGVTFLLSGGNGRRSCRRVGVAHGGRVPIASSCLDLADVTLVNREAMKFLAGVEAVGAVLINCPDYVRSWIDAEQGNA